MGLRAWWSQYREQAAATRLSVQLNGDQELIASQVPELTGMTEVQGMAYVMQQLQEWSQTCTPEQAIVFAARLVSSNETWNQQGLTMPYWGNLWVLRTLQAEIGLNVPSVASSAG